MTMFSSVSQTVQATANTATDLVNSLNKGIGILTHRVNVAAIKDKALVSDQTNLELSEAQAIIGDKLAQDKELQKQFDINKALFANL